MSTVGFFVLLNGDGGKEERGQAKMEKRGQANNACSANRIDRFMARTRYFTDSGIIGSREFVRNLWEKLRQEEDNPDKIPIRVAGLDGLYSLKRLSENIL